MLSFNEDRLVGGENSVDFKFFDICFQKDSDFVFNNWDGNCGRFDRDNTGQIDFGDFTYFATCVDDGGGCVDSDGGKDYFVEGEVIISAENLINKDICKNQIGEGMIEQIPPEYPENTLAEFYCGIGDYLIDYYVCSGKCSDGACIPENKEQVCQPLIDRIKNPQDFFDNGVGYELNWNGSDKGEWWIDGQVEEYKRYSASWRMDDKSNDYESINLEVNVFENNDINSVSLVESQYSEVVCKKERLWSRDDNEHNVYICNWDVLYDKQELDRNDYGSRNVYWANDNVMVSVYVSFGRYLTEEEFKKIGDEFLLEFLQGLIDNNYEYIDWEEHNLPWASRSLIEDSLGECYSDLEFDESKCNPNWYCKTEPLICPPHGEQIKTCVDNSCGNEDVVSYQQCSPGICSGCYVKRWYDSRDNKCIPYGFRFERDGSEEIKLIETQDEGTISEGDHGDYLLEIVSNSEAILTLEDKDYKLIEGERIDGIKFDGNEFDLETIEIDLDEGVVELIVFQLYEQKIIEEVPSYCDIDGRVKLQKEKDYDGSWAKCQNNYECESNLCSSGECIEITDSIVKFKGIKNLLITALCRVTSFSNSAYNECLSEYLN